MASNIETSSGGYDVHVIEKYPKELNCGICALIIHNAMHGCINHAFCKSCIMKHIECRIRIDGNVKCPGGCGLVIDPSKLEPNKFADRMINTLTTKCGNENCMWQGDLLDLVQVHQMNCDYLQQYCSNAGCWETYLQKDLLQHEEACLFKLIPCSYCHTNIFRKIKENHEFECSNEKVNCSYYDLGCEMQLCRKDVASHEETHQATHMRLLQQNLTQCLKQLSTAKNEIVFLKQENETSNNEIELLKHQIATANKNIIILKQQNGVSKVALNSKEGIQKANVVDIGSLKYKLSLASHLYNKVSLLNNGQVMIVKRNNKTFDLDWQEISECYYRNSEFDYLIRQFGLGNHKDLMLELFKKIPCHLFQY